MSKLNTVVLPAPLGPIRPYSSPFSIEKVRLSTARRPPNEIDRLFT